MATQDLQGLKVAILVTDGFEQVELMEPRKALDAAGAKTQVVSPKNGKVRGWKFTEWGDDVAVDVPLDKARADEFDALLLPGGVINPDNFGSSRRRFSLLRLSSMRKSRWLQFATGLGRSLRRERRRAGRLRPGHRLRLIFAMPELSGWTKNRLPTGT